MIEVGEVVTVRARDEEYQALVVEGPFWRIDRVDGSEPCTVDEEQLEVIGERAAFDMVMRALRAGHQNDRSANELFTWLRNMRRPRRETSVGRASTPPVYRNGQLSDWFV